MRYLPPLALPPLRAMAVSATVLCLPASATSHPCTTSSIFLLVCLTPAYSSGHFIHPYRCMPQAPRNHDHVRLNTVRGWHITFLQCPTMCPKDNTVLQTAPLQACMPGAHQLLSFSASLIVCSCLLPARDDRRRAIALGLSGRSPAA